MEGAILLDFQKSTKITLSRYLNLMEKQLKSKIDGPVQFLPIPNQTQLFNGRIDIQTGTPVNLLVFKLKLNCIRQTSETGEKFGLITLQGTERLGVHELTFNLCLLKDFHYTSQEDMMVIPWQEITIKLPPTHLTVNSREGSFKLTFDNNFTCWARVEVIQKRVDQIVEKREIQRVDTANRKDKRSGQEAGYDRNIKLASAPYLPMVPTPYVISEGRDQHKINLSI